MLNNNKLQYLKRQFTLGRVSLFLGAGFSADARNQAGEGPPIGFSLAQSMAALGGFEYANEPLSQVYKTVKRRVGASQLNEFLRSNYSVRSFPDWYQQIPQFVWHRIYTTNIDNLIEAMYRGVAQQSLDRISCPSAFRDADPTLARLQYVKLHGDVEDLDKGIVFSLSEFAKVQAEDNAWYNQLVDDVFFGPVIYVGTLIEESAFHHYLEVRGTKAKHDTENRPGSFLVCPTISDIRKEALAEANITPVEATGKDFFRYLTGALGVGRPTLVTVNENLNPLLKQLGKNSSTQLAAGSFSFVNTESLPGPKRIRADQFYLGAVPTWKDIEERRDGDRQTTNTIEDALLGNESNLILLQGPAGSGKTTILMRLAFKASAAGHRVYWANRERRLELDALLKSIAEQPESSAATYIFVDAAANQASTIRRAAANHPDFNNCKIIAADRTNSIARHERLFDEAGAKRIDLPDLGTEEIESILQRLESYSFLGNLRGMSHEGRVKEFQDRSRSQLLVAMKEATSGRGFDEIIEGEYEELEPNAKLAYTMTCLAVAQGAPGVYRRHLLATIGKSTVSKGQVVESLLRGVLVPANQSGNLLTPRHRIIAFHIARKAATQSLKTEALLLLLTVIAPEINKATARQSTPYFKTYTALINSSALLDIFGNDPRYVLEIYDQLRMHYESQFLFWLHYGRTFAIKQDLETAMVYLEQAEAVCNEQNGQPFQIRHQKGIVRLSQAVQTLNYDDGREYAEEGERILSSLIDDRGNRDSYPYVAYLEYLARWYIIARHQTTENQWQSLKFVAKDAAEKYRLDGRVQQAAKRVDKAYLVRLTPDEEVDRVYKDFVLESKLKI